MPGSGCWQIKGWIAQREQLEAHSVGIASRLELPEDGFQVSVDEGQLRKVAEIGGGKFFVAMDTNSLNNIFTEIDKLEKTEVKLKRKTDWKDLFQWFIASGAVLAALHAMLSQTLWRTVP